MNRRSFLGRAAVISAAAAATALLGCSNDEDGADDVSGRRGGLLRMAQAAQVALDAGHPFALIPQNRILGYASVETLVEYRDQLVPELVLAERFELSEDYKSLLVVLKPDIEFHNGATVTAQDVLFGVELLQDPVAYGAMGAVQLSGFARMIADARVVHERTMEFRFDQPRANIVDFFAQLPVTHAASWARQLSEQRPIGSGPFQIKEVGEDGYDLERFDGWHGGRESRPPKLDGIKVSVLPDQVTSAALFRGGDLDAYLGMSPNIAATFRDDGSTRIAGKTGINYLGMNVENSQLVDPRVRRAILHAIDSDFIAAEIGLGFSSATAQPWSESSPAFDPDMELSLYDPDLSRKLLEEAGYAGNELELEYGSGIAVHEAQAEVIFENLSHVGIDVRLRPSELQRYSARYQSRQFEALWLAAHAFADFAPLTLLEQSLEYRPDNLSHYRSASLEHVRSSLSALDPLASASVALYEEFNQLWLKDPFLVSTGIPTARIDLVQSTVAGWPRDASGYLLAPSGKVDLASVSVG